MTPTGTYLALFVGSKTGPQMTAWNALSDAERNAKSQQGMAAWHGWMTEHQAALVDAGGPLGKTKRAASDGIEDVGNDIGGFVIVRAQSPEAAAKLFENHPHFAIFPGEAVEVMPVLSIPGM
jgi:hypothetical protein